MVEIRHVGARIDLPSDQHYILVTAQRGSRADQDTFFRLTGVISHPAILGLLEMPPEEASCLKSALRKAKQRAGSFKVPVVYVRT